MLSTKFMLSNVLTCLGRKVFCMFIVNIILTFELFNHLFESVLLKGPC